MKKKLGLSLFVVLLVFSFLNSSFGATYSFKSVWNERLSYDPTYFSLGTFNDISAGAIITGITDSEAATLTHDVRWIPPGGGSQQTQALTYREDFPNIGAGNYAYSGVLAHDVSAASFGDWENNSYGFYIDDVFQSPSVITESDVFAELTSPVYTYDSSSKFLEWQEVESRIYRVRILGSENTDDVLFDSETIRDKESYQFTDLDAIMLLDAGAILSVEARQFKNENEFYNTSIYISQTTPIPVPATIILLGSGLIGLIGIRRKFRTKK